MSHVATQGTYNPTTGIWNVDEIDDNSTTSRQLQITATVKPPTGTTNEYKNIAAITGTSEADSSLVNNVASAEVTPLRADVELDKSVNPLVIRAGNNVVFTIEVVNNGPNTAMAVQVTDVLPAGYSYDTSNASAGSYSSGTGIWTVGIMSNGTSATLTITAKVKKDGDLMNTATVSASPTYDDDLGNNSDNVTIVRKPAVVITNPNIYTKVN